MAVSPRTAKMLAEVHSATRPCSLSKITSSKPAFAARSAQVRFWAHERTFAPANSLAAKRAWGGEATFHAALLADDGVGRWLRPDEIERAMDLEHHLAGIDATYHALGLGAEEGQPA